MVIIKATKPEHAAVILEEVRELMRDGAGRGFVECDGQRYFFFETTYFERSEWNGVEAEEGEQITAERFARGFAIVPARIAETLGEAAARLRLPTLNEQLRRFEQLQAS